MIDIKLFIRNLTHNKLYFAITVFGFAIALTFVFVLCVYIRQELSMDQFHKNKDRIYRLVDGDGSYWGAMIGSELKNKYPEIDCFSRYYGRNVTLETTNKEKVNLNGILVDSAFFRMFSFPLVKGDPATVFLNKNSIVLTLSYARKVFGTEDIIGKEIEIDGEHRVIITGILEDIPYNTHFLPAEGLMRFDLLEDLWGAPGLLEGNGNSSFGLYIMTYPATDITLKKEVILAEFMKTYWKYKDGFQKKLDFEPLTSVYWGGKTDSTGTRGNSKSTLIGLSTIALLILILALINYNNLSIAQTTNRAKEAAIKKLVGTNNGILFVQFISESVILCALSFMIALLFSWALTPFFEQIFDTRLYYGNILSWKSVVLFVLSIIVFGSLAGIVPAWMITRFKPVEVVKGVFKKKMRGVYGNLLICFQYVVAIALTICSFTILLQSHYLRNYKLGFDQENVVYIQNGIAPSQKEALRSELMRIPGVINLSYCAGSPLDGGNNLSMKVEDKSISWQVFKIDTAFFHVLNIQVEPTGADRGVWVNRTAVKELELGDKPQNFHTIKQWESVPIAGITDDFHFNSLRQKVGIAYMVTLGKDEYPWSILIRIDKQNPAQTYQEIKKVYGHFIEGAPFDSGFMDQSIDEWYKEEDRAAGLIGYFTVIACMLAIMGILAMATYFIQQRLKEIGLRRVNGAKVTDVLKMLIWGFVRWVLVAFLIATPIAWYFMNRWLAGYPYHVSQQVWIYLLVGVMTCIIAVLMVGWQSYKAAVLNPVKTLRND